jgi:hypothetical protein
VGDYVAIISIWVITGTLVAMKTIGYSSTPHLFF